MSMIVRNRRDNGLRRRSRHDVDAAGSVEVSIAKVLTWVGLLGFDTSMIVRESAL